MAKKRGAISPLGNATGSEQAIKENAINELQYSAKKLKEQANALSIPLTDLLESHLGINSVGESRQWTLKSGKKATFTEITLTYEQVKNNTTVTFSVNGRDQSMLTRESLKDLDTLEQQQFYPAIGRRVDGKIDLLDGSRRRARLLLAEGNITEFKMLVTDDDVSVSDAKALASSLQVAKEHTLREIGLRLQQSMIEHEKEHGISLTQLDLSQEFGLSQSKVSKALKAASIDERIIALFPDANELSHTDYSVLAKAQSTIDEKSIADFIKQIHIDISESGCCIMANEMKDFLIRIIKETASKHKEHKSKPVITELAQFDVKDKFARKKVSGRKFTYEFNRLPAHTLEKLDEAINQILQET